MTKKELDNGLVELRNGFGQIVDTRTGVKYDVAQVKKRDIKYFKDAE